MSVRKAEVGIVIGSVSDREIADAAAVILDRLKISHELTVASAHRDPEKVRRYAKGAERRGVRLIIAVAGLAAALPGVLASHTTLPVLGVPVPAGHLKGIDAILSMVQMPSGVPVGTLGLGTTGGKNAALLAARVLARGDADLKKRLVRYQASLRSSRAGGSR